MILRHAYLENREFEPCRVELPTGSPALRNLTTVLYNLFSLFNPLQARLSCAPPCYAGHAPFCEVCKQRSAEVSVLKNHDSAIHSWGWVATQVSCTYVAGGSGMCAPWSLMSCFEVCWCG